ncbi:DUF4167 domain-containing protein [Sphingomonas sp.]|uniref:DUF4167 domain-containing protein n=1 Tax=Sphingomonas sp. TaxID=28214 RepID=UPI003CC6C11F
MINNRQAGRRRGRGGGNNSGRQGGGQQGNGSRIDSRARGNATQLYEKYKNMAADAQRAGDRVNTEYYLQFADHYFRVLSEQRGRFEDQQQPRRGRDEFDYDGEEEYADEGDPIRGSEQFGDRDEPRRDGSDGRPPREDRYRDGNAGGNGDARPRDGNRDGGRENGAREFRRDRDGNRDFGRDEAPRPRNGEWRDRRPDGNGTGQQPVEVAGQRRAEPMQAGESLEARAEEAVDADRPLDPPVRRRGRPRREEVASGDGLAADLLPPSLSGSLTLAANDEAPVEAKPRRRRLRTADETTPDAAE